jgi:hypothetical protein
MKTKNLTKREALTAFCDMFQWLADNPWSEPGDYFIRHKVSYPDFPSHVNFLCQWVEENAGSLDCSKCPLINFWPGDCLNGSSPLRKRQEALYFNPESVRENSLKIVAGCNEVLAVLKDGES